MPFQNKIHKIEKLLPQPLLGLRFHMLNIIKVTLNIFSPLNLHFQKRKKCLSVLFWFSVLVLKQIIPQNETKLFFNFVLKWNNERQWAIHRLFLLSCLLLFSSFSAFLLVKPWSSWSSRAYFTVWLLAYTDCQSAFVCKRANLLVSVQSFLVITTGTKINHWAGLRCSDPVSSPSQRKSISRYTLLPQRFQAFFFVCFNSDYIAWKKRDKSNAEP